MNKTLAAVAISVSVIAILLIHSCTKSVGGSNAEPITIIHPDSLNVQYVVAGTVQPISIQFTTDRPIIYAKCMYEVDSPGTPITTTYTYPDTLFLTILDTIQSKWSNKYTYTGSYLVPDSARSQSVIRFDVQMKAAIPPPNGSDTVFYDKQFKMTVR